MKRKIVICVAVVALLASSSGCGLLGGGSKSKTSGDGRMKITWLPQCDGPVDEDSPVIAKLEEEFNVDLDFMYLDRSKMVELLNVRIASGEIPDVMRVQDSATFSTYIDQGIICDIPEEILLENGKTLYDITKKNGGDNVWEYIKADGKMYGIPLLSMQSKYASVPIWREDWLKKVGINNVPETLDDAEKAFYAFANNDPDGNGVKDTYGLSDKGMAAVYGAFGIQPNIWQDIDGEVVYTSVTPQMKEALQLLNKWYKDGVIDPEFISGENKGQYWANTLSMWNGKIGFSVPGSYYHVNPPTEHLSPSANYTNFKELQGEDANYVAAKPFTGKDGKSGTSISNAFGGAILVFGRQVKDDPEKMAKIIEINNRLMEDLDLYAMAVKGIEGEHHEIRDGRYYNIIDTSKDANAATRLGIGNNGIGFISGNQFDFSKEITVDKYEYADEVAQNPGYANVIVGSLPSAAQSMATISAKVEEANVLFITGQKSFDEWDAYVEELNNAGLKQLTKEANEWYKQYN